MATFNHGHFQCCYQNWIAQQHQDLEELLRALTSDPHDDNKLQLLTEKSIKHFQEYLDNRALLAQHDAPSFLSPSWCTTFENSFLWIGGCRPSLSIRLVYSLSGSELEANLTEFLQGERTGNLGEISAHQLNLINSLHCKTIREEDKLSTRMASLQEDIADEPLVMIAKNSSQVGESSVDVYRALDTHALALASILVDADKLRLSTLKELMDILTPLQAVDLLAASKKLHLSMHEWGKRRDQLIGKIQEHK
uniref:Putative transcription factor HBP-1b(C38)-like isoform X1 n=1 Tax=Davidia involucrata TaxID=16924 RepID=A0A5B7BYH6_DAVIN